MPAWSEQLRANLQRVRERIAAACQRAGRPADAARLIAVTKYAPPAAARELVLAGCTELGESRPQALWTKAEELAELRPHWHMIGHLQRNKVQRSLPLLSMIHSLDSVRLLDAVEEACRANDQSIKGLLEVNISGDAAKHGFRPEELPPLLERLPSDSRVEIVGLMGMAGLDRSLAEAQREFAGLRELRDRLQAAAPPHLRLDELSMGMSNDFEQAIAEGATLVRIGSLLMEGIAL